MASLCVVCWIFVTYDTTTQLLCPVKFSGRILECAMLLQGSIVQGSSFLISIFTTLRSIEALEDPECWNKLKKEKMAVMLSVAWNWANSRAANRKEPGVASMKSDDFQLTEQQKDINVNTRQCTLEINSGRENCQWSESFRAVGETNNQ